MLVLFLLWYYSDAILWITLEHHYHIKMHYKGEKKQSQTLWRSKRSAAQILVQLCMFK